MTKRSPIGAAMVLLVVASAVPAGCGGDEAAFVPVAGADSAYCDTYRAYKAQEIDGGGAYDQHNPAALRKWWNAYVVFEETMLREAPSEIRHDVAIKVSFIRTFMSPLLEKYDFDAKRMEREAAAEAASFLDPPPDVRKAEDAQHAYEARTCGTEPSPPAADVVFTAGGSSKRFCTALSAFDSELDKVAFSRFDPDVLRTLVTGDRFSEVLDGLDRTAPPEIAADVEADTEWFRTRWSDVVAKYDYDIRRIYVNATPEDLAVFNRSHPDVAEYASRNTAYEEQVCAS
jgi:hypothetical protein